MKNFAFLCIFIGLPIWGGYTGDKLLLWFMGALGLMLPMVIVILNELPNAMTAEEWEREEKKRDK